MDNIIKNKKKSKKQKQKINNNIVNVTKPARITTKINLNNKYIRQDKELLEILKLFFVKKKRKTRNNKMNALASKNKSSAISGINATKIDKIAEEPIRTNFIPVLGNNHNVNTYRMLENEIIQLKNNLNNKRLENRSISLNEAKNNLLENKKDHAINWTHSEPEAFELVRKVAKHRDPEAAKKLVTNVPEFKGMMEDLAELGASSAKEHIKTLNKDFDILEENSNKLDQHNTKLNDEIDELNNKIRLIESNKDLLESQTYELQQELEQKQREIDSINKSNDEIRAENKNLLDTIEKYKNDIIGLDKLFTSTKYNLDKAISQEVELNEKIQNLNDIIEQKQEEIRIMDDMRQEAEKRAAEEFKGKIEAVNKARRLSQESSKNLKNSLISNRNYRLEKINNMTVHKLRKELGINDKDKYIKVEKLKQMLIEKEGLNEPLDTPLSTPAKPKNSLDDDENDN